MRRICLPLLTALFVLMVGSVALSQDAEKPNILFVFADDQCFETVGAMGNPEIQTPNIDTLVESGTVFTHAYNMGSWSGAVCVASRTMLNTGRFIWRANAVYNKTETEREEGRFWSEMMKSAGYDTYMTGKWHVRADANLAFDTAVDVRGGMPSQTSTGYNRPIEGEEDPWSPSDPQFGGFWEGGRHWSEVVADHAVDYLGTASEDEDPFFMYIAFNAPHDPRQSPQEFVDMYPWKDILVPENYMDEYPYNEPMSSGRGLRDEKLAPFPRTHYAVQVNRQEYYAIITHMDREIGRILEALEASGKADNTYIFYSADHGLACGQHGLMGKQNLFDHSTRVPLYVIGPDVPAGEQRDGAVYLQDIMATSLELADAPGREYVEFQSLMPIIEGDREANYEAVYGAYLASQRSITLDGYKLILYPKASKSLLFDLENDPLEMTDLSDEPDQQARVKSLFAALLDLQTDMDDTLDLEAVYPELCE
jgi:arylsulfatase A-like enzyme